MSFTSGELSDAFPVNTTANLIKTIRKIDDLVQQGVFSDNDLRQLLPLVGTALDANIEHVTPQSAVYSGTAGAVSRQYFAVPVYPLPTGGAQNPAGLYINQLTEQPAGGRGVSPLHVSQNQMLTGYLGASAASPGTGVTVASTAAELDNESNYVTITAPASSSSAVAGVTFDIYCVSNGKTYLVKSKVAAGQTAVDGGQDAAAYVLPAHTNFAVDKSGSTPVVIAGLRTIIPTN